MLVPPRFAAAQSHTHTQSPTRARPAYLERRLAAAAARERRASDERLVALGERDGEPRARQLVHAVAVAALELLLLFAPVLRGAGGRVRMGNEMARAAAYLGLRDGGWEGGEGERRGGGGAEGHAGRVWGGGVAHPDGARVAVGAEQPLQPRLAAGARLEVRVGLCR